MATPVATAQRSEPAPATAFYCVCDSRYFLGFVALLNSLRLVGHDEPIFLVDAGLDSEQRDLVAPHATLVPAPEGSLPVLLAPVGPTQYPARVAILLDVDIVVVRPLTELIAAAQDGRLIAFVDNAPHHDRFFSDWGPMLGLGPLRRHPYLNAGQLVVPQPLAPELLRLWSEGQAKLDVAGTRFGRARLSDPFYFADQDVLNAVIGTCLEPDQMIAFENRLAPNPPFTGVRLVDRESLLCRYADGAQPFLLHHFTTKPWLQATRTSVYSLLLTRLLLASDVTLRLEPKQLPLRLREGWLAATDRRRANVQAVVHTNARRQLGRFGIRTRLAAWRQRHVVPLP